MKIWNLTPENAPAIEQVAELLVAGFGDTGSASWRILGDAIEEVQNSLQPGRISRIAVNEQLVVLGWIGGIEEYDGNVWYFFSSRRRHTRLQGDWSSDVCSSD